MNSRQRKKFESDIYDQKINQDRPRFASFFHKKIYTRLVSLQYQPYLDQLGKKYLIQKSVLALGASHPDIKFISQFTSTITANNISQIELDKLTSAFPSTKTILSDAENLSNINQKFDVVFCRSILHHLHPIDQVLDQISQVLKPNGTLFIYSEPGYYHPFAYLGRRLTPSNTHTPGEKAFKFNQFEHQLQQHFMPISVNYFFFISIMLAIIPTRLPFTISFCRLLVKPTVKLETWLSQFPLTKNLYWITSGVYRKL